MAAITDGRHGSMHAGCDLASRPGQNTRKTPLFAKQAAATGSQLYQRITCCTQDSSRSGGEARRWNSGAKRYQLADVLVSAVAWRFASKQEICDSHASEPRERKRCPSIPLTTPLYLAAVVWKIDVRRGTRARSALAADRCDDVGPVMSFHLTFHLCCIQPVPPPSNPVCAPQLFTLAASVLLPYMRHT